ncbi:MAG TPA: TonB-dependent receptor [Opitutaceae bacterium]|nr:TonB-dependent receptor [Opitutaceae bacterium]
MIGKVSAQSDVASSPVEDEVVELSPFAVVARASDDRYAPAEAISGGRVRATIFDSSQNITAVSGELLTDVAAIRILDSVKYVAGVTESTIPNGLDRITIRGFQTSVRTLDGITTVSQSNIEPVLIERLEVVKGPNAILAPAGVPGGTINAVSKKPMFRDSGSLGIEAGLFDSQRAEVDVNRVFGSKREFAVRVLGTLQETKDWWGLPKTLRLLAPMFSWRISPAVQFTWQTHYVDWHIDNYNGLVVDPSTGTTNEAKLYEGIPRDFNIYGPDSFRNDGRVENTYFLTAALADSLSLRLQGRHSDVFDESFATTTLAGNATSAGVNADSFEPLTGNYTPGIVYARTAPYLATPVTISRTYNRSGQIADLGRVSYDQQADLFHVWEIADSTKLETLLGAAYSHVDETDFRNALTAPPVTLENYVYSPNVVGAVARDQKATNETRQVYLSERVTLFDGRLIANAGYSWSRFNLNTDDRRGHVISRATPEVELVNYGVVVKPLRSVALFYSHSENAAPLPAVNIVAGGPATQEGRQDEGGVRVLMLDGRLRATASYYDLKQSNVSVANPGNFAYPPPVPSLPTLLSDRAAHGVEFELQGSLTEELAIMAAYTKYRNRNPFGQAFRGNADVAWSAFVHYVVPSGSALHGLSAGLGIDYLGERPGDDASGFTPAGVARKPSFYLPARTLTNLTLAYRFNATWNLQVNVDNLFDVDYLAASLGRSIVWPGTPLNVKARLTFRF